MRPLSVLFFGLISLALFSVSAAALVRVGQRTQPPEVRRRRTAVAAALPVLLVAWLLPARFIWSTLTGQLGVEIGAGLGAERSVALPNGYELSFSDADAHGDIRAPDNAAARITEVTEIAVDGALVFGIAADRPFLLDTSGTTVGITLDFDSAQQRTLLQPAREFGGSSAAAGQPSTLFQGLLWCVVWLGPPGLLARRRWMTRSVR